jgi:hypothetical protein
VTADDPEVLTSTGVEVTQEMWDSLVAENERLRAELAKQSDWNTAEFDRFGTPPIQEKP